MTGNLVWILFRAHHDSLSGAIEVRTAPAAKPTARVFVRGRRAVHVEGIGGLLSDLAGELPSSQALTGELANDVPVCLALGIGLDDVFAAACAGLGRGIATLAQDPGLHCSFDPDVQAPGGAFPLPTEFLRCFHRGLREIRDADVVALELQTALDNQIRITGSPDDIEEFGAIVLRAMKLARVENTLRGLIASSGRGQPGRTREAWFAVDLLMQLGLLQVEGSPVARASAARGPRARARAEERARRLSEEVVSALPHRPRFEADDEATDVFAMGEDTGDLGEQSVDDLDEVSIEEDDEPDGASHTIDWPARPASRVPSADVHGGLHEADDEATDVFALGGDDDFEDLSDDSIEYLDDDEEWEDDSGEEEGDPESLSAFVDVAEEEDWEDDLDDDVLAETTPDQPSEPPRLRPLADVPDPTSPDDPTEGLDHPDARELVDRFHELRGASPLAVLDDARERFRWALKHDPNHVSASRELEEAEEGGAPLSGLFGRD